jgi:uncharacterized protein
VNNDNLTTSDNHKITLIVEKAKTNNEKLVTVFCHGLFTNKREDGRSDRFASRLLEKGSDVVRFDFRGHGDSNLPTTAFNVTGAIIDLLSVMKMVASSGYQKINLIGSSFGGSIALLYMDLPFKEKIDSLVLLNPVVDYQRTIKNPQLEKQGGLFSAKNIEQLLTKGKLTIEEGFDASLDFINQLLLIKPFENIKKITIPTLVFHGTNDDTVSHLITVDHFEDAEICELDLVENAGHAFKSREAEEYVQSKAVDWLFDKK